MKLKYELLILLVCTLWNCRPEAKNDKCDFLYIVIQRNQDTLKYGEVYRAKISLSDTSLLYLVDEFNGKKRRTHPVFRINGQIQESGKDYFIFEEIVDSVDVIELKSGTKIKDWSCGVIFPHPNQLGDVELGYRMSYVIDDE